MKAIKTLLFLLFSFLYSESAPDFPYKIIQPDGYSFYVNMYGSEYYNYIQTLDGYTITSRNEDGDIWWYYGEKDKNKINPSNIRINGVNEAPDSAYHIKPDFKNNARGDLSATEYYTNQARNNESKLIKPLVILIDFENSPNDFQRIYSREQFASLFFDSSLNPEEKNLPPTYQLSVLDYFSDVSGGDIIVQGDINSVTEWIELSDYAYFVDGNQGFGNGDEGIIKSSKAALVAALNNINEDPGFDMQNFDGNGDGVCDVVILIMEGWTDGSSDRFWSYKSSLYPGEGDKILYNIESDEDLKYDNTIIRNYIVTTEQIYYSDDEHLQYEKGDIRPIGTICHELGHVLGLPDLYDTSDRNAPGIGDWGLMGTGNWNNQVSPSSFSAWSMQWLGIVDVEEHTGINNKQIVVNPIYNSRKIHMINIGLDKTGEYLLLENRTSDGVDNYLKNEGLLIWHIDERQTSTYPMYNAVNTNPNFYGVKLLEAAGNNDLTSINGKINSKENHVFDGSSNITLNDFSYPDLRGYSYDRDADGVLEGPVLSEVSISSISRVGSDMNILLSVPFINSERITLNNNNVLDGFLYKSNNPEGFNPGIFISIPSQIDDQSMNRYLKIVQPTIVTTPSLSINAITIRVYELGSSSYDPIANSSNIIASFTKNISWLASENRDYGKVDIYAEDLELLGGNDYFIEVLYHQNLGFAYLTPSSIGFDMSYDASNEGWLEQSCFRNINDGNYSCIGSGDFAISIVLSEDPELNFDEEFVTENFGFLYPNPSENYIKLQIDGVIGDLDGYIYNLLGQEIFSFSQEFQYFTNILEIPTKNLPNGIYFLLLYSSNRELQGKFKFTVIK